MCSEGVFVKGVKQSVLLNIGLGRSSCPPLPVSHIVDVKLGPSIKSLGYFCVSYCWGFILTALSLILCYTEYGLEDS